jgi:hypothetical protein
VGFGLLKRHFLSKNLKSTLLQFTAGRAVTIGEKEIKRKLKILKKGISLMLFPSLYDP